MQLDKALKQRGTMDAATRAQVGEVFKRATNIAKEAPAGAPGAPPADAHASELALFEATRGIGEAQRAARGDPQEDLTIVRQQVALGLRPQLPDLFLVYPTALWSEWRKV